MIKTKEEMEKEFKGREDFDNKLDLLKFTAEVHSRIKDNITSDFVLAKTSTSGIDEKKRDAIIELTADAYYSKVLFEIIKKKGRRPKWNNEEGFWKWEKVSEEEKSYIRKLQGEVFDMYLLRPQMLSILSRNISENKMMEWLTDTREEEKVEEIKEPTVTEKVKNKLTKNEERKE